MEPVKLVEFARDAHEFDALVDATADIDHFCSSSRWILPAAGALMPRREPWLFRGASGRVAMMRGMHPEGWHYLEPLEASWGLACPLIGPDAEPLASEFVALCHQRRTEWDVMLLMGLPVKSPLLTHVSERLARFYDVFRGQVTSRLIARLDDGIDGFLSRRSRNLRKALRKAQRAAADAGIAFEYCDAYDSPAAIQLYERIQQIECRSWKGRNGVGIDSGPMYHFYRAMVQRLASRGELRVLIATHEGRDIAYVLGGVCGGTYRGLQFSFDSAYERYSLGNLGQYQQIIQLIDQGVESYDLGTDMDYKHRWAESTHDTVSLIVYKRSRS